jgi:hypothetical protein
MKTSSKRIIYHLIDERESIFTVAEALKRTNEHRDSKTEIKLPELHLVHFNQNVQVSRVRQPFADDICSKDSERILSIPIPA